MFPSKYIRSVDMSESEVMTIDNVIIEEIGQDNIPGPVVYFKGNQLGLILNKTNAKKLKELFSPETDNWKGKQIDLYRSVTTYMGEEVDCLRIRPVEVLSQAGDPPWDAEHAVPGFDDELPEVVVKK